MGRTCKKVHQMDVARHTPGASEIQRGCDKQKKIQCHLDTIISKACEDIQTTVCHKVSEKLFERLKELRIGEPTVVSAGNIYEVHRAFTIFNPHNKLFECALINKFPGTGRRPHVVHHFLVVKIGSHWRIFQSMANRYTLSDYVSGRWEYIFKLISSYHSQLENCNLQLDDIERSKEAGSIAKLKSILCCFRKGYVDMDSHLESTLSSIMGQRDTAYDKHGHALLVLEDLERLGGWSGWLDSRVFVQTVLALLIKCLKNTDDECFLKLFGADRHCLKIENQGKLVVSVKSVAIISE